MELTSVASVRWIGYTTRYRQGSKEFAQVAATLEERLVRQHPGEVVLREALESKADFVAAMDRLVRAGVELSELHFIGHAGMYGMMFGSTDWPEQLSPYEWRTLAIPFARGASAYFHACRTARWFAPFFASTFGVRAYGYHGYTSFSRDAEWFVFAGRRKCATGPLHVVSVPGRKSHGLAASFRKYSLRPRVEPMAAFEPARMRGGGGYDEVAALYDRAFSDIRLRRVEWSWVETRLDRAFPPGTAPPRVLDIGCGNGALLEALATRIATGVGVDVSPGMLEHAKSRAARQPNLSFTVIDGPLLPFPDATFDVVTCFLSFRYLDWDPMLTEIRRVLAPGGRLLIVDIAERPLSFRDTRLLFTSLARHLLARARDRRFVRDLALLTAHPDWEKMLVQGRRLRTLSVGRHARLVAFDSGPVDRASCPHFQPVPSSCAENSGADQHSARAFGSSTCSSTSISTRRSAPSYSFTRGSSHSTRALPVSDSSSPLSKSTTNRPARDVDPFAAAPQRRGRSGGEKGGVRTCHDRQCPTAEQRALSAWGRTVDSRRGSRTGDRARLNVLLAVTERLLHVELEPSLACPSHVTIGAVSPSGLELDAERGERRSRTQIRRQRIVLLR
jgi:ubiquinone/menaquinone biosynthesis C-methylase UbiE